MNYLPSFYASVGYHRRNMMIINLDTLCVKINW